MGEATAIAGVCDPAFEPVRQAFAENFASRGELGAACAVYVDGRRVVDLWGGYCDRDRTRRWQRDTLVGFYSVGKAMTALCALHLCQAGRISLDDPVQRYWQEFARHGKGGTRVRDLLAHRAGLPAVRARLPEGAMLDWATMTRALAQERPWWPPGQAHGYHTNTFGFLLGEVVRRVSGLSLGDYLRRHITEPLGADLAIGLRDPELARVAELDWPAAEGMLAKIDLDAARDEHERMLAHAYYNPSGLSSLGVLNSEPWRRAQVPSTNGHGTARGVAKVYAALASGGEVDGVTVRGKDLLAEARSPQAQGLDRVLQRDMRWGLGFQLTQADRPLGPNPHSFGHFGNGGSLGFADPSARVGFGYVLNNIVRDWRSPRNRALIDALYSCF